MINNMTIRRKAGIYVAVLVLMVFIVGICLISIVKAEPDEESKDKSLTEQDFYQANDVNFLATDATRHQALVTTKIIKATLY